MLKQACFTLQRGVEMQLHIEGYDYEPHVLKSLPGEVVPATETAGMFYLD